MVFNLPVVELTCLMHPLIKINRMKKLLLLIFLIAFSCLSSFSQEKFHEGKMGFQNRQVDVLIYKSEFRDKRIIIVETRLPKYKDGYPHSENPAFTSPNRFSDYVRDTLMERKVVESILGDKIKRLKENKEKLTIAYKFGQDGNVIDIEYYTLVEGTLITPKELEKIDENL